MRRPFQIWSTFAPATFVILWSTGFIGARLGIPYAEPFIFLFYRFVILAFILALIGFISRAPWPKSWSDLINLIVVGLLIHASYLGGVFWAISQDMPAANVALIVGTQPLLTAVTAGFYLGEKVGKRQWFGLVLGFLGVALVVSDEVTFEGGDEAGVVASFLALLGITAGTLYQKKYGRDMDLRTGSAIQFASAAVATGCATFYLDEGPIHWSNEFIFALTWLILVLSIGAISLLYLLIRQGAAASVSSLFYLVPPVVAIEAYFLFDEALGMVDVIGMVVVMIAVALVNKSVFTSEKEI